MALVSQESKENSGRPLPGSAKILRHRVIYTSSNRDVSRRGHVFPDPPVIVGNGCIGWVPMTETIRAFFSTVHALQTTNDWMRYGTARI